RARSSVASHVGGFCGPAHAVPVGAPVGLGWTSTWIRRVSGDESWSTSRTRSSVRVSGSLSRIPPSVYQSCFDGGKVTIPRAPARAVAAFVALAGDHHGPDRECIGC